MAAPVDIVLGIDVAKAQLDVAVVADRGHLDRAALAGWPEVGCRPGSRHPAADPHTCWKLLRAGTSAPWWRPCRGWRWWWSIRAKPATSPAPTAPWPRPIASMPAVLARFAADVRPPVRPQPSQADPAPAWPWCGSAASWWSCGSGHPAPAPPSAPRPLAAPGRPPGAAAGRAPRAGPGGGGRPAGRSPVAGPRRLAAEHPRDRPRGRRHLG